MSEEAFIYEAIRTPRGKQRGGAHGGQTDQLGGRLG
jgi:hypothetical protein